MQRFLNKRLYLELMGKYFFLIFILISSYSGFCRNDTVMIKCDTSLHIKKNKPFTFKFIACPSCGYRWSLDKVDSNFVKLINFSSKHTSGRNDIVGGNVYEFWKFKVVSAGTYILEFIYKRPWLTENEKVFRVELHVK